MKKILSMLLCLCFLLPAAPVAAEELPLVLESVAETVRPGKAVRIAFTVPESGAVSLRLVDAAGEAVSTVVEDYWAAAGSNELVWNGTFQGVFAPEGSWQMELYAGDNVVGIPVTVGPAAPYLTNIMSSVELSGQHMTVTFYASVDGLLSVGTVLGGVHTALEDVEIRAGENVYVWDMSAESPDTSALTLTLTDSEGYRSNEEHIAVGPEDFGFTEPPQADEPEPDEEDEWLLPEEEDFPDEQELPAGEEMNPQEEDLGLAESIGLLDDEEEEDVLPAFTLTTDAPMTGDLVMDEVMMDELPGWEDVNTVSAFTPSYSSPYAGQDTSLNYWTMPMDITDEETVWNVLMQPMTILYSNANRAERTQVVIRQEPDENSKGLGVVTRINQGVHVLETLDNGWSLIECYSSSFHDSKVQAWNMLVQGYVKSDQLRVVEPQTQYGIVIDKLTQRLYLFKDGHLFTTLLVSTGLTNAKQPWNETRSGEFFLTSAVGAFKDGNLTYEMAIRFNSGDLMHEIPHYTNADGTRRYGYGLDDLGSKASHGCIRVQRYRTPEGVNMSWLWSNRVKNTKLLIWEDWQGRQIPYPSDDLILYYNTSGGEMYHSKETCYSAEGKTFTPFSYGELELSPYSSLKRCPYCAPALRHSEIDAINANYIMGGDHDPIITEARQKYINSLNK